MGGQNLYCLGLYQGQVQLEINLQLTSINRIQRLGT